MRQCEGWAGLGEGCAAGRRLFSSICDFMQA